MSAAPRRLYRYRSTLVERIERIEKELAVDLKIQASGHSCRFF